MVFYLWVMAVVCFLGSFIPDVQDKALEIGRVIPAAVQYYWHFGWMMFFVYHGWWFTAVAVLLLGLSDAVIFSKWDKQRKESEA